MKRDLGHVPYQTQRPECPLGNVGHKKRLTSNQGLLPTNKTKRPPNHLHIHIDSSPVAADIISGPQRIPACMTIKCNLKLETISTTMPLMQRYRVSRWAGRSLHGLSWIYSLLFIATLQLFRCNMCMVHILPYHCLKLPLYWIKLYLFLY